MKRANKILQNLELKQSPEIQKLEIWHIHRPFIVNYCSELDFPMEPRHFTMLGGIKEHTAHTILELSTMMHGICPSYNQVAVSLLV